jgi:hypothetical protein
LNYTLQEAQEDYSQNYEAVAILLRMASILKERRLIIDETNYSSPPVSERDAKLEELKKKFVESRNKLLDIRSEKMRQVNLEYRDALAELEKENKWEQSKI